MAQAAISQARTDDASAINCTLFMLPGRHFGYDIIEAFTLAVGKLPVAESGTQWRIKMVKNGSRVGTVMRQKRSFPILGRKYWHYVPDSLFFILMPLSAADSYDRIIMSIFELDSSGKKVLLSTENMARLESFRLICLSHLTEIAASPRL